MSLTDSQKRANTVVRGSVDRAIHAIDEALAHPVALRPGEKEKLTAAREFLEGVGSR